MLICQALVGTDAFAFLRTWSCLALQLADGDGIQLCHKLPARTTVAIADGGLGQVSGCVAGPPELFAARVVWAGVHGLTRARRIAEEGVLEPLDHAGR